MAFTFSGIRRSCRRTKSDRQCNQRFESQRLPQAGQPCRPHALKAPVLLRVPWSFSPDGRRLAYQSRGSETGFDLWTLPLDLTDPDRPKAGKPDLFLATPAGEAVPSFSPDGRWIAYRSNKSGSSEIYVRPFPAGNGGEWPISDGGGVYSFWSRNSRELFYETTDGRIMVTEYSETDGSFVPGKPRIWSDKPGFWSGFLNMALAPDGKHFIVLDNADTANAPPRIVFLLNFFDELKRRIPPEGK